jgi:glycosyltransferase involved in cell wall biosynthesis
MVLFPARWQEPFGILGVEALAQGTPVVVADRGGTSEWSSRGCLRVPAGDVPAMAEAIRSLADSPERATTLGREGQSAVRKLFARETIVRRLLELYEEIAA